MSVIDSTPTQTSTKTIKMFEEQFDDGSRYLRLADDSDSLIGTRIKGEGKIVGATNAKGELHPAFFEIEGSHRLPTLDELAAGCFKIDGRCQFVEFERVDE